jgi:hypothetical protein
MGWYDNGGSAYQACVDLASGAGQSWTPHPGNPGDCVAAAYIASSINCATPGFHSVREGLHWQNSFEFYFCECPPGTEWNGLMCATKCPPPEKWDGQKCALECPIKPLSDDYKKDACAASLEEGRGTDVRGACPTLTDDTKNQERCLAKKITQLGIPYSGPTATFRPVVYQNHLREVWQKWLELGKIEDPEVLKTCSSVIAQVKAEKDDTHGLDYPPAPDSNHTNRTAFDISRTTIKELMNRVSTEWDDVQTYVDAPPACHLRWGGRFGRPDRVHFELR